MPDMIRSSSPQVEAHHDSVLVSEALEALALTPNDIVVDATLGGAGHFSKMLAMLGTGGVIVGIDADAEAVERARTVYALDRRHERPTAHIVNDNFRNLTRILERLGIGQIDAILFDLGWSGYQIAAPRGFSFQGSEPLLMTYGESGETAADIVNSASEEELAGIIHTYGEERFARGIARAIVAARAHERILTTDALVAAIKAGTPSWYHGQKNHPATKTFQALRIAANDELGSLREGLAAALQALAPGGRIAIISFHSIEDRAVKHALREAAENGGGTVSKKPLIPSRAEILANRRARSAKLRVFERAASTPLAEAVPSDGFVYST